MELLRENGSKRSRIESYICNASSLLLIDDALTLTGSLSFNFSIASLGTLLSREGFLKQVLKWKRLPQIGARAAAHKTRIRFPNPCFCFKD
jgi:hypothetical protein